MSSLSIAVVAVAVGVGIAYFFPGLAKWVVTWSSRFKNGILAVVGLAVAFYFLSTGSPLLVFIGFVALVTAVWQIWFNDPFGWLRPLLPV